MTAARRAAVSAWRLACAFRRLFARLSGGSDQIWIDLVLFLALLIGLRVVPAVLRELLPFSAEAKQIWFDRRQIAKRYDSYQWQKLFWVGLGLLPYAVNGGLRTGEAVLTADLFDRRRRRIADLAPDQCGASGAATKAAGSG